MFNTQTNHAPSPCIKLCKIDEEYGWCSGCFRTLNEIATWGSSSPTEQYALLAQLNTRANSII